MTTASTQTASSSKDTRNKILSVDELAQQVAQLKAAGKKVVQAHGAFDLLHLGHVKHLEAAHAKGDALIVTLTADRFVNKGPNRPIFTENLRAEMLSALEIVDFVAVNHYPDAVQAIKTIQPNFYAKGQDYVNPDGDITGKITEERDAIESVGGAIVFTEEMTFSSTELMNRNLNIYEPHLKSHLDKLRDNNGLNELNAMVESLADMRVLVVGDAIIDEYQYVLPMGKSAKENMIATRYQDVEQFAGGVFATANHIADFCKEVEIITVIGDKQDYSALIRNTLKSNVTLTPILRKGTPTTCKTRFVDPSYLRKLFEVYRFNDEPLNDDLTEELNSAIAKRISEFDVVIANDFGHGMIGRKTVSLLCNEAKFLAVNTQSNSANMGYNLIHKYPRADYVCIDAPEARLAVSDKVSPIDDVIKNGLRERIDCTNFIITNGKHGCVARAKGDIAHTIPALTKSVVDTVGAGDAFLAITAPLVAKGYALNKVGFIGNIAGALKVAIVGHQRSVEKVALLKSLTALLK